MNKKKSHRDNRVPKPGTKQIMIWDVPEDLKRNFKRTCVDKGVSMKEAFVTFMEQFVANG